MIIIIIKTVKPKLLIR